MTIVDGDGHVTESTELLARYIDPAYRDYGPIAGARSYYPTDGWDRSVRGTLGESGSDAKTWLEALDRGGVESAVLYPTAGLGIGWVREPDFAVALCRAYNDFFHQELMLKSPRLKGVALLPLQDVKGAVDELRRARALGFVGALLEAGCTWVPYWLGRMDEEWEKRGALEAPGCKRKPSEYLTDDRIFYPAEASEWLLGPTAEVLGKAGIFYASDWPHWDNEFPENIHHMEHRKDLSDELKRQIFSGTARRLYGL